MQKAKVIAKQPPMPPADEAAAGSSIGFGRRGDGGESHAVQGAGQGGRGMIEVRNPARFPTDLNPAEEKFARCLAEGKPCIVGNGELPEQAIESGEGANMVRSEVIRFFAYGGNEENPVLGAEICLLGAWISGNLNLTHASIPYALMFGKCHFAASVMMLYMKCAALYLNGSCLVQGLLADGLTTKSSVNLRDGFSAKSRVRLLGANIGGSLECVGGKFQNLGGEALSADRLTTKGNVHFQDGFSAEGEVRLSGADIGGDLNCAGGQFHNPDGDALSADKMTVKGEVKLSGKFSAEGNVRLLGANIDGDLNCTGGNFHNPNKYALMFDKGKIGGVLFWWKTACTGNVSLAYARADVLADDSDSWKSCKVILDGFTYNRFANPMGVLFRIDWLAKRPDRIPFSPLPYEQAAKVLFGMGHVRDAREILLEKECLQTKYEQIPWLRKVRAVVVGCFCGLWLSLAPHGGVDGGLCCHRRRGFSILLTGMAILFRLARGLWTVRTTRC